MVLLWTLGMMFYSNETQSAISHTNTSTFTWHTEESFHAPGSTHQINSSNNADEEKDDKVNDEDEPNSTCAFSKKDISFTSFLYKESLILLHPKSRLLKALFKTSIYPARP